MNDNQLFLPDGKLITFNNEQYEAIQLIREWLNNEDKFFTLAGYAGTGKSTCIKKILDESNTAIVVSAPTHKAKKVVVRTTGQKGETLQALLGLRPDIDLDSFNPNSPQFGVIAEPRINKYNIVIIDEASMINEELFNLIKHIANKGKAKVLFMGDPAQTPPIGEKESEIIPH